MKSMRTPLGAIVVVALLCMGLQGCPPDVGLQLLVSPETLDFGMDKEEIRLRVYKTFTGAKMAPLIVSTDQDWILPQNCLETTDNCVSSGPEDAIRIPVRIDRARISLGVNEGRIRLNAGTASEVVINVLADEMLQADFRALERTVGLGRPVEFRDMSLTSERAGTINQWLWEFGDGSISTRQNPSYLYSTPGVYTVTLTITTDKNISRTVVKAAYIQVTTPNNLIDFVASSVNVDVNEEIIFTDISTIQDTPVLSRSWDFGDGSSSTDLAPRHRYALPGIYTVSMTITTNAGNVTVEKKDYIVVRSAGALRANFTYNTSGGASPYVGEAVLFFDLSEVGRGTITDWRWEFGDGGTSREQNPQHTYVALGTYTVKLTVVSEYGADSVEKSLTVIYRPPVASFIAEPTEQWAGSPVLFIDQSVPGYGELVLWQWSFGDTGTSFDQNPIHIYTNPGVYTVTLTVTSNDSERSSATLTRTNYITVKILPDPPEPGFVYAPRLALTDERVSFDASSTTVTTERIEEYRWNFGDGVTGRGRTTTHRYTDPGRYDVTLTVITESTRNNVPPGVSVTRTVAVDRPPNPEFSIWRMYDGEFITAAEAYTHIEELSYMLGEQPIDARPIRQYAWEFGDNTVSNLPAPTHTYTLQGQYTTRLTIKFRHSASRLSDPDLEKSSSKQVRIKPSIWDYVYEDDNCFYYSNPVEQAIMWGGQRVATAYMVYNLTSQCWNPRNAVVSPVQKWTHPVVIYEPEHKVCDTAMLFVDGGSRTSTAQIEEAMWQIAVISGTTVVHLKNVPSQPIVFVDEVIPNGEQDNNSGQSLPLRYRVEDEIIAYSYDKYLDDYALTGGNPDYSWPLLFPMVKSAVKAMDMTEEVLARVGVELDGFVVTGASKRGWTTWLTGAVDSRVKAIAPIVINVLNMKPHLEHHRQVYGYWAPAIYDYAQERVFERLSGSDISAGARTLLDYVDPYEYSLRGSYPIPKFLLNATGDEFFVPDTAELYFHKLEPDAHMSYVPNVGHGMGGVGSGTDLIRPDKPTGMLLAWYMAVTQEQALPQFTYTFEANGAIRVPIDPSILPVQARLWTVTAEGARDFRNYKLPPGAWSSQVLPRQMGGETGAYYITPPIPVPEPGNYTAYFVQLEYENSASFVDNGAIRTLLQTGGYTVPNMVFSTGVRVIPEEYPEFTGYLANVERPDAVLFDQNKMPVIVVHGTPEEMGNYYGQLMAPQINAFVRDYLNFYLQTGGANTSQLRAKWDASAPFLDPRLHEEMLGISRAAGINVTLDQIQLAHAAFMFETLGTWVATGTAVYRELMEGGGGALSVSLNSEFHRYQCAVLYIPDEGAPHTVFTYAGLTFGRTGVNVGGIAPIEAVVLPVVDENGQLVDPLDGTPFVYTGYEPNSLPLIRTILYDTLSLREAMDMVKMAPVQRNTIMLISDGRNENRAGRLRVSPTGGLMTERYDRALYPLGITDKRGVNWASTVDRQLLLVDVLPPLLDPQMTWTNLLGLASTPPFAATGENPLNVVIDTTNLNLYVAIAKDVSGAYYEAYQDTFDTFNMQLLLP